VPRKVDYLYRRPGSQNWWLRLQSPGRAGSPGKDRGMSLRTPNRAEAEIAALPIIADHKAALLEARPRVEMMWHCKLEPGRKHTAPDGGEIIAKGKELIYIGHNGAILRTEPNGGFVPTFVGREPRDPKTILRVLASEPRPVVPTKNGDDALFEIYIRHANLTGHFEHEARSVWALFKTLTDSKPLKDCDRNDGRKLAAHYQAEGLKSATMRKKIGWLVAAVNLAIDEGKLTFNPFSGVVPKLDDKEKRLRLDDEDIAATKRNIGTLSDRDRLLWRLLATTGMRLSEAFEIDSEATERGVRYIITGKKTEQSLRRVPLPADVLKYLPKKITGKMFGGSSVPAASKRLNRFLDKCGIVDKHKTLHSLRHRAQDRLRAAECPEDIRWAILGHEEKTVAAGYGEGFPMKILRKWVDKIGF
jgi:integrase